jgi:hypothetical protein
MKASLPRGEGSLQEKASPLAGRKWRTREGSGPVSKDDFRARGKPILPGSPCRPPPPPGNAHGGCTAEVLCGGLAESIITTPGVVMKDRTGWSSPIGAARQTERKTAQGLALHGYTTTQSRVTSVAHVVQPLWYPLEYKRRARPRWREREAEQ